MSQPAHLLADDDETAPITAVSLPRINQPPTAWSTDLIAKRAGALRDGVGAMSAEVEALHVQGLLGQLVARTDEAAKRAPVDIIEELASIGFSWTGLARLVGVSIPALRKWRKGEPPSGENRRRLARIVAFVGVVEKDHLISDVASWLDVRLADSSYTALDVFALGHVGELLEYAANKISSTELLDRTVGGWRQDASEGFEVFEADDGERAIRLADAPGDV